MKSGRLSGKLRTIYNIDDGITGTMCGEVLNEDSDMRERTKKHIQYYAKSTHCISLFIKKKD